MELENILKLINAVSDSHLTEFVYKDSGESGSNISLKLTKRQSGVVTVAAEPSSVPAMAAAIPAVEGAFAPAEPAPLGNTVNSPLVGTFYTSSSPEEEPFVRVGDQVKKGQVLGIIEAMKLMNEVESEYDGVVKEILAENGTMVEYGQPLFVIR